MDGTDAFVIAVITNIACAIGSIIYWVNTNDGQFMAYSWVLLIDIIGVGIWGGSSDEEQEKV